jgi:putative aldouronate transport system permease protein
MSNQRTKVDFMGKRVEPNVVARFNRISMPANLVISLLFIVMAISCVLPVVFVLIISLSSDMSIQKIGYSFVPLVWSAKAFGYLWLQRNTVGTAFLVSVGLTMAGTALGLFLNATMGYVLSRPGFKLKKFYTMLIFIPMLFGGGLVASYMINTQVLMLKDTYLSLFLPAAVLPMYIIILRTFFRTTVPDSLIESAKIDGALQTRIFIQIVLPISLPALATIGLFLSFRYWNEWFLPMLYISSDHTEMFPLQYVLINIQQNFEFLTRNAQFMATEAALSRLPAEAMRMALVVVVVLPIACLYPFFQKYFITGLTIGAVKG